MSPNKIPKIPAPPRDAQGENVLSDLCVALAGKYIAAMADKYHLRVNKSTCYLQKRYLSSNHAMILFKYEYLGNNFKKQSRA